MKKDKTLKLHRELRDKGEVWSIARFYARFEQGSSFAREERENALRIYPRRYNGVEWKENEEERERERDSRRIDLPRITVPPLIARN